MFSSIRWRLITIYFLLVFIAMVIVGVFITNQFETYYLNKVRDDLRYISNNTVKKFLPEEDLSENYKNIQKDLYRTPLSIGYQISIIDVENDFKVIASTNKEIENLYAMDFFDEYGILLASKGKTYEKDINEDDRRKYRVKHMAFPYEDEKGEVIGIIYCMANLDEIYNILDNSKIIFIKAMIVGLLVTVVLGFLVSTSITNPINDVTKKALKMAKGDFDQVVEVRSDDEIGQLGRMFNYLTAKLKQTLSEMSSEKGKLDAIINHMADGLLAVDFSGQIMHLNPRFMQLMCLEKSEIEGKKYDDIMGKYSDKIKLSNIMKKGLESGSDIIEISNGTVIKVSFVSLRDSQQEVAGIILVLQDITEHQKLENMRKEFVANVSHELKTPITTIKSYAETILSGAVDDMELQSQFLKVIEKESDRMAMIVKDLLKLSKLDNKNMDWNFEPVDAVGFISSIAKKLSVAFNEKNHTFRYIFTEDSIIVNMDSHKMEQAIQNILTNCIKYTPDGGEISLSLSRDEAWAHVSIRDNGMGIPKEDLPRIFERFYRVDKARSRDMGGTGLGLSITKHIIEEHGGMIHVESEVEKGSTFTISIPTTHTV